MKRAGLGLLLLLSSAAFLLAGPEKSAKTPAPGEQDTEDADTIREQERKSISVIILDRPEDESAAIAVSDEGVPNKPVKKGGTSKK